MADESKQADAIKQLQYALLMPLYQFSCPMDYAAESYPPQYEASVFVGDDRLPVPPPKTRPGYSPDDDKFYLTWGKEDHDHIVNIIKRNYKYEPDMAILDWGCSSGRVLRHFHEEYRSLRWRLMGTDIQALLIEWMRQNFPPEFKVIAGTTFPHLPYKDSSIDIIYGISVFTHTKYLWDAWLTEFQRVLKPGGLVIQTVQCEHAWRFYHQHQHLDWVRNGHPASMLQKPELDADYFLYGDPGVSQTFFKEEVLKRYWGRIMDVVEFLPPNGAHYQNWVVLKAP